MTSVAPHRGQRLMLIAASAAAAFYVLRGLTGIGAGWFADDVVYSAIDLSVAALCLWRGRGPDGRAWTLVGVGVLAWSVGDLLWVFYPGASANSPSLADAMYLAFYPCAMVAVGLLARRYIAMRSWAVRLDGVIGALGLAAVFAIVLDPALHLGGSTGVKATNLAYVVEDLVLLAVIGAMSVTGGRRAGVPWGLLAAAMGVSAIGDAIYLVQSAHGTYVEGGVLDASWPVSLVLLAWAAMRTRPAERSEPAQGLRSRAFPLAFGAVSLAIPIAGSFTAVPEPAIVLAALGSATVLGRLILSARETDALLRLTRREAATDALTGLANRRVLLADLEILFEDASAESVLAVFDLNGFKGYNDTFGHPAGDALLTRIGKRLAESGHGGKAYRLGGDEFCLLAPLDGRTPAAVVGRALPALEEEGEGFSIDSSHGFVVLPTEAAEPSDAMRVADRRMYADKHGRARAGDNAHLREALLRTVQEGHPDLGEHQNRVAALAAATARELDLDAEEADVTVRTAELHDIGKIAIPDEILNKAGPLSQDEWTFIRRHTIVGERILSAAPPMLPVARAVRSSHENWDGSGYPDAIAGEQIPVAARIVAVCDAFDVMTTNRPYKAALSEPDALAELRACAARQFDPRVVEAFARAFASGLSAGARRGSSPPAAAGRAEAAGGRTPAAP